MNGVLPVFVSITVGSVVLVQVSPAPSGLGEVAGWVIALLILIVGALLTVGIRDFQRAQKETREALKDLSDQVFSRINDVQDKVNDLHGDFREHLGRERTADDVARHLADRLLAQKKTTYPRAVSSGGSGT